MSKLQELITDAILETGVQITPENIVTIVDAIVEAIPNTEMTSERIASLASKLMKHEDPDVRSLAASCMTQRG